MNERIRELMMDATKDMDPAYYWPGEYVEKFADLIVQECIQLARQQHKLALANDWDGDKTAYAIRDSIEQHFYKED